MKKKSATDTMFIIHTIQMFEQINRDCKKTREPDVPITFDNIDYYIEQMQNLEFTQHQINLIVDYLYDGRD
jgi:hypothetical protein